MAQRLLQQKTIRLYSVVNCLRYRDSAKSSCPIISEQRVIPIVGVLSSLRMVLNWKSYSRMRKRNHWYQAKKRLQPYLMIHWMAYQTSIKASEKCTEQTITPSSNENVSERKETASTAKVVAISIGVPSCLDIPPNNMRLDIAADKPFPTSVGDCLCGVGKVVHTLPLPHPRSKEISELITYTNFYNTS